MAVDGNKSSDANTIIVSTGLKVGDEIQVPGDKTINAIKNLWALNIFSDVQIIIDKQLSDGVFLLIKVKEYPRLEKVVIEGNDEIDTDDIEKKISFLRGSILKPQEVAKLIQKINGLYEEEGYYNTEITVKYFNYFTADTLDGEIFVRWRNTTDLAEEYEVEYSETEAKSSNLINKLKERLLLKIEIKDGDEVSIREIAFSNNTAFDDDDLKVEWMKLQKLFGGNFGEAENLILKTMKKIKN